MARDVDATALVPTGSGSLRTTVPKWIVKQFNLKAGEKLEWGLIVKDNKMVIEVSPKEVV